MADTAQAELNGLHPEKLNEILDSFRQEEVFKAVSGPWRSRIRWESGFRAKAYMRTHVTEMDEPTDLDATDLAASAHESLLSAIGGCMTVGFVLNATKQGIKIHDLEIALEGNFENIRKWAGRRRGQSRLRRHQRQGVRARRCRRGRPARYMAPGRGRFARNPDRRQGRAPHHRLRGRLGPPQLAPYDE